MPVYADLRWLDPDAKPAAPRDDEEARLLHAAMTYLAWALPADAVANHCPGEGKRSKTAQVTLKRSGYQKGWPDIEIIWRGSALFVELKSRRGVLSEEQRSMHRKLTYCGCPVICAKSLPAIECALLEFGVPLKARLAA